MLALTGNPFCQEESYDHFVRERVRGYVEMNPVRVGLVNEAERRLGEQGARPTK